MTEKCQQTFYDLKKTLMSYTALITTNASSYGLEYVITQMDHLEKDHLIVSASKKLLHSERNNFAIECGSLSILKGVKNFRT